MMEFATRLEKFYDIIEFEHVVERESSSSTFHSHRAMSLHSDHCDADCVAWWCKQPAAAGGESLLLDTYSVLASLPAEVTGNLSRVMMDLPRYDEPVPLLVRKRDGWRVYYADWLTHEPDDPHAADALAHFERALADATPVRLRLEQGQWLLIDNHRVMHGRAEFTPRTDRHLVRLWLQSKHSEDNPQSNSDRDRDSGSGSGSGGVGDMEELS